jgi:glycosyltransferase involved in cell wall biosynthesis
MRIAILAPPYLPVPPPLYGGTEKIVSLLTEGLVANGHDVTLFASGDSVTSAKLAHMFPKALGNSGLIKGDTEKPIAHYHACYARAAEFDIIHSHGQYLSLPEAEGLKTPVVFTWHGSMFAGETTEEKRAMLRTYKHLNFVSISNNQRDGLPELHYVATVYNALDLSEYPFVAHNQGDYLLWIGRVSPKKGPLDAIRVAKKLGIRLEMAAAIDPIDRPYFEQEIKPHIDGKQIIYHGEVGHDAVVELYAGARCTLYPISWHEPFGLVMVESMACATPVVAYNIGSVSELVRDGISGYVVQGMDEMVAAVKRIDRIDRAACRKHVEEHFHKDRMVEDYLRVYGSLGK